MVTGSVDANAAYLSAGVIDDGENALTMGSTACWGMAHTADKFIPGLICTPHIDYSRGWDLLLDAIGKLADEFPDKKFSLEYKLKEPRKYLFISSAMKALWITQKLKKDNIGVLIDFGHALMSKENPAEVVYILSKEKKLFGIHFNDAYREWDDDLIAGSINIVDTLEFIYYLDKVGYDGWISFDIFPFRMDGSKAVELCIKNTENLIKLAEKIDRQKLAEAQKSMKAENSIAVIQEVLKI